MIDVIFSAINPGNHYIMNYMKAYLILPSSMIKAKQNDNNYS